MSFSKIFHNELLDFLNHFYVSCKTLPRWHSQRVDGARFYLTSLRTNMTSSWEIFPSNGWKRATLMNSSSRSFPVFPNLFGRRPFVHISKTSFQILYTLVDAKTIQNTLFSSNLLSVVFARSSNVCKERWLN